MGMTVVEKILARAAGLPSVNAGRRRRAEGGPRHVARECGAGDQPVPGDLRGHGPRARRSGIPRASPSSSTTACRPNRPRPPPTRRRSASSSPPTASPSSTTSAATSAASATRSCPSTATCARATWCVGTDSPHHQPRRAGRLRFGIGATEMASVWSAGHRPQHRSAGHHQGGRERRVPEATWAPKDLILHLIGKLTAQGANFKVLEFHGETIRKMSTSGRLVICNMSVEAGATSGIVPGDEETVRYLREEAGVTEPIPCVAPDADARYERTVEIDVSALEPQIACPHTVDNVKPIERVAGTKVQQIVIGSCTNGRLDDLAVAAEILQGQEGGDRHPHAGLSGLGADLRAGAGAGLPPGLHEGRRRGDELRLRPLPRRARRARWATTRWRSPPRTATSRAAWAIPRSEVYLCSPAVAAASRHHRRHHRSRATARGGVIMGKVVLKLGNDISTDDIYPGPLHGHGAAHGDAAVLLLRPHGVQRPAEGARRFRRQRHRRRTRTSAAARAASRPLSASRATSSWSWPRASRASSCRTPSTSA